MSVQQNTLQKEIEISKSLAKRAGIMLYDNQHSTLKIELKKDNSPVTNIDKMVSTYLSKEMARHFPGYGMLDEESAADGIDGREKEFCWVIDPLDGTLGYINGDDNYGVFIGLIQNHKPVLGVTYAPCLDELCYAVRGAGAYLESRGNTRQLAVNRSADIDALVSGHRFNAELEQMLENIRPIRARNMYTSFKFIEVAKGNANLFLCPGSISLCLWDMCAPSVVLEEAGGIVTDLQGNAIDYANGLENKKGIIASNGLVHDYVINHTEGSK